jgi:hypothetical protein
MGSLSIRQAIWYAKLKFMAPLVLTLVMAITFLGQNSGSAASIPIHGENQPKNLPAIHIHSSGTHFVLSDSNSRFIAWGLNYDHDRQGRLIEDYWNSEWPAVESDFQEMKALGANVVRVHLQLAKFMNTANEPNQASLKQLAHLLALAQDTGLYLDITGLGCYHKKDVPKWYDRMNESDRWDVQARFWTAVSKVCSKSPAVFCYDLMNEPILPGDKKETEWLTGELGGKFFIQRITLDLAGRTQKQVAKLWVDKLVAAIRKDDGNHMITVGVIPWALTWPNAKPLFYSSEVSRNLDYVSVHFYPEKGQLDKALKALEVYNIGKPLVVEEMFPLNCSLSELSEFVDGSQKICDGWIGFYWGKSIDEYDDTDLPDIVTKGWLKYFKAKAPEILNPSHPR